MDKFVEIYKKWVENRSFLNKAGLTSEQRKSLAVLDNMKKRAFNELPDTRRQEIARELVAEGVLPDSVLAVMEIFDARVVSL